MGKIFITDEVNDMRTARVTAGNKLKTEQGAALFKKLSGNRLAVGATATAISTVPCMLHSVIMGQMPTTSTYLSLYDCGDTSAGNLSTFGTTSDNILARLYLDASAGLCANSAAYPRVVPFNVYCASGLYAAIGEGYVPCVLSGNCSAITITYQT